MFMERCGDMEGVIQIVIRKGNRGAFSLRRSLLRSFCCSLDVLLFVFSPFLLRSVRPHAMALHFLYYNFVRIHKTLKTTPAMAAGVTDRLWEIADMVEVLEAWKATT